VKDDDRSYPLSRSQVFSFRGEGAPGFPLNFSFPVQGDKDLFLSPPSAEIKSGDHLSPPLYRLSFLLLTNENNAKLLSPPTASIYVGAASTSSFSLCLMPCPPTPSCLLLEEKSLFLFLPWYASFRAISLPPLLLENVFLPTSMVLLFFFFFLDRRRPLRCPFLYVDFALFRAGGDRIYLFFPHFFFSFRSQRKVAIGAL